MSYLLSDKWRQKNEINEWEINEWEINERKEEKIRMYVCFQRRIVSAYREKEKKKRIN